MYRVVNLSHTMISHKHIAEQSIRTYLTNARIIGYRIKTNTQNCVYLSMRLSKVCVSAFCYCYCLYVYLFAVTSNANAVVSNGIFFFIRRVDLK